MTVCKKLRNRNTIEMLLRSYEIETAATIRLLDEYNGMAGKILASDSEYAQPIIKLKIGESD